MSLPRGPRPVASKSSLISRTDDPSPTPLSVHPAQVLPAYGRWEPLSSIIYGYVLYPFSLSSRGIIKSGSDVNQLHRDKDKGGKVPNGSAGNGRALEPLEEDVEGERENRVSYGEGVVLEVGDEVYAFERYLSRPGGTVWYRGYVARYPTVPPLSTTTSLLGGPPTQTVPTGILDEPLVTLSIFPSSIIHVRDELNDYDEGKLADAYRLLRGGTDAPGVGMRDDGKGRAMETLNEEEELLHNNGPLTNGHASHGPQSLPAYPTNHPTSVPVPLTPTSRPPRPLPSLKVGDDTTSGTSQPLIDEIASALREWHALLFVYLARRDYKLFSLVRAHIEALHLGRRQLLAQTLSAEETIHLRRDCVARLVRGNVAQGLDVIVRHPAWGGLVTVDVEGAIDPRSWVSAVRMYAMQVSLAYIDAYPSPPTSTSTTTISNPNPNSELPHLITARTSALNVISDFASMSALPSAAFTSPAPTLRHEPPPQTPTARYVLPSGRQNPPGPPTNTPPTAKFYHVYLDLRAFVANPCAPGETAELFFSLYDKNAARFLTEDFCAVLNHNGVPARDWNEQGTLGKLRTLFTDLGAQDVQDAIYLVCKIVRHGAMKSGSEASSGGTNGLRRGADTTSLLGLSSPIDDGTNINGLTSPNSPYARFLRGSTTTDGPPAYFRRPFGCAVLELSQLTKMSADRSAMSHTREHIMPIFVPCNEGAYSTLHQDIIASRTREFEKSPRAEHLAVNIKVFHGEAATIIRENPSLLQSTPITARLVFPDVVFPSDSRNDIYIKLWSGQFSSSSSSSMSGTIRKSVVSMAPASISIGSANVQVTVEVRTAAGAVVEKAISKGSGEPLVTQFQSMVFLRNTTPTYGELIKLQLPVDIMQQCHLFFTFRHRSARERAASPGVRSPIGDTGTERPFAFSFLPLFPDGRAFVTDGEHILVLYRADRLPQIMAPDYLEGPCCVQEGTNPESLTLPPNLAKSTSVTRDTLTIRSYLCSTKFTQNATVLELLDWEKLPDKASILRALSRFTFGGEGEIVKFLRDIFDSLFAMLVSSHNQHGDLDDAVFNALVTVLGIIQDRRFTNFQPVLEVYIEQHFSCAPASSHLIHSMNRLLSNPGNQENAKDLRSAFRLWHYIFRFIIRARQLQKTREVGMGATSEHLESSFKREIRHNMDEVNRIMSAASPPSIGTQTIALQHFTSILPDLAEVFTTFELVNIATGFANSIAAAKGKLVIWKLLMYLQLARGFLFDAQPSRTLLVEAIVSWIKPHFGKYDEYVHVQADDLESARDTARISWLESTRLCITIVAVMLDKIQESLVNPAIMNDRKLYRQEQENVEYVLSLLPKILEAYRELQSSASLKAIARSRSPATTANPAPIIFPSSYPFSLVAIAPGTPKTAAYKGGLTTDSPSYFNCTLAETGIVLLVIILSSPKKHLVSFLESTLEVEGNDNLARLLSQFFRVSTSILSNEAFPNTWLNVNILAHKVILKMADPIANILVREYIPEQHQTYQFNSTMWREAFTMLFKLLSSPQLVIEDFSPQKRRAVWRLAGDLRVEGAAIISRLWDAIGWPEAVSSHAGAIRRYGGYQVALATLVDQVLSLCLSHHDQLRNSAVEILYCMIVSEYQLDGHFNAIENELINTLDKLFMADTKGDQISRDFFIDHLRTLFESSTVEEQLRARVSDFLDSVDLFLELLLNVRELPEGDEYQDDRVIATLRLMNFIRRIGRDEIYIKYVHQLVNMHLQSQNYVEAALMLKLHADLYEWDLTAFVEPMPELDLPRQSQFMRKDMLSLLVLDYLGKGKAWEIGVEICKELAAQHSDVTFNYQRLSEILIHQATLLEHIVNDQRYYPDYFRVGFYGNFPAALRNKHFIYRGYEWEKFGAFCERMLNKHPSAQLLKPMVNPSDDIKYGQDQYLQCTTVVPEPDRTHAVFLNPDVPQTVRSYYEHSEINVFSFSKPFSKEETETSEFRERDIWVEKTYFTTEAAFPTVLRRSEIVDVQVEEISPIENALNDILQKTKELSILEVRYASVSKSDQPMSTNPLSMSLNGAVDAPVNGGVALYRQAFLGPDYVRQYPDSALAVQRLRDAIDEQVRVIDRCLQLHGQLCPPEMIPFHETLERFFRKNFHEEIRRLPTEDTAEGIQPPAEPFSPASAHFDALTLSSTADMSRKRSMSSAQANYTSPLSSPLPISLPPIPPVSNLPLTGSMYARSSNSLELRATESPVQRATITTLQRSVAHLSRNGISGLTSGPNDRPVENGSASPDDSFVNVHDGGVVLKDSGASSTASTAVKSRLSRFGSLSWTKR